jgi:hypothetical protein
MRAMVGTPVRRILAAWLLVLLSAYGVDAATSYSQTIYRSSAFSTQATDYYCTAAVVQNIRNLATGESRTGKTQQTEMYAYGRAHNRYAYSSRGVDPQGVEAMLEHYVEGSDWKQVTKGSLKKVLRVSARRMRATGLPAVLFVGGGRHAWTMNGYTATGDPASADTFRVTHIRFSGPFYPKQVALLGWFDLAPNSRTSVERLAAAFFPYHEPTAFGDNRSTPWNGSYVAVVPVSVDDPDPTPTPTPTPKPSSTPAPSATPQPTVAPTPQPTTNPTAPPTAAPIGAPTALPAPKEPAAPN